MAETNLRRGLQLSRDDFTGFLTNPISGTFLALAALSIAWQMGGSAPAKGSLAHRPGHAPNSEGPVMTRTKKATDCAAPAGSRQMICAASATAPA